MLRNGNKFRLSELLFVFSIIVLLIFIIFGWGGFSADESVAIQALENAGYSSIKVIETKRDWWGGDYWIFTCIAKNVNEETVTIYVSYSYGEGSTIRHK